MSHHYPKVGEKAPDFELPAVGDKRVRLSNFAGEKNVILSFHPLAWTGLCAAQMQDLEKNIEKWIETDTVALGVSVDSIPTKDAWADSLGVTHVEFLSDFEPKGEVAQMYGVYRENGFSERAIFVIDREGTIRFAKVYPIKEKPDLSEIFPVLETRKS
ncbi:MAG: redoxin domain-containing protein [Gemmatimonadota bacterium]|nr:MAG: redoxin domain-containing protein [Gemmatimonadota bacterium]